MGLNGDMMKGAVVVLVILAGTAVSCRSLPGWKGKDSKSTDPADPAATVAPTILPVGSIQLVDTAGRFVLVRSSKTLDLEPGTMLGVHGEQGEVVAQVQVSPARKGPYLTADFVSGTPLIGQKVTVEHQPKARESILAFPTGDDPNAIQVLE